MPELQLPMGRERPELPALGLPMGLERAVVVR